MKDVITIERLPEESNRAYAARVEYVTAGPQRSLDDVAQKWNKSRSLLARWSTQYDWAATARAWDDQQAAMAMQEASEAYRRDLEDHRKRYGDAGKALYQVAAQLLTQLSKIAGQPPKVIEGKDGKPYKIPGIDLTPTTLTVASRAMTIAADLEAHALRIGDLLPKLDHDILDSE